MKRSRKIVGWTLGCAVVAQAASAWAATLPAFPGAEGFGANSVGGRGGDVYHVTSLDDPFSGTNPVYTPGTLRYGLRESGFPIGGRTIVFDVGGTILLNHNATLDIKNISKLTIAGQTAPSPINIIGDTIQITGSNNKNTNDIILQYITARKGTGNGEDAISIKGSPSSPIGTFTTNNIIVDHVSGSWSEDEVISVTQRANNVTVQYSMMSEALTDAHAYGSLIRPEVNSNVTYSHNLYSSQKSRNPRPGSYDGMTLNFEFQNNVIYNWSDRAGYINGADGNVQHLNMNYVGNYLITGPVTPNGIPKSTAFIKETSTTPANGLDVHIFQADNKLDNNGGMTRDGTDTGWDMFKTTVAGSGTYSALPVADQNGCAFQLSDERPDSPDEAYGKVISSVGSLPYSRSTTDGRLINDVLNYTGTAPLGVTTQTPPLPNLMPPTQQAEWDALVAAPAVFRPVGWDTDSDGMPNTWETLRGFNPGVPDDKLITADGYTRLEKYLHYLTAIANWNIDASGNWSDYLNWRGTRPTAYDSTANFTKALSTPQTVNVDIPVTVGQMKFSSLMPYTLAGGSGIALQVISGSATIDVLQGSHAIWTPVVLGNDTIVTTAASSGLTITNFYESPSSVTLTKAGAGGLAMNNVRAAGLDITGGTVLILPNGTATGVSRMANLAISAGAKLDLTDNHLVTATAAGSFNGSVYTGVAGMVQAGRGSGTWNGTSGIVTSQSNATAGSLTSVGVARASDIGISTTGIWAGQTVSSTDTLVMYTYAGDANLDGKINIDDYTRIDGGSAMGASGWSNGDFNYDGKINIDDYVIIDNNIANQGPALFATGGAAGSAVSAIPEPTTISVISVICGPLAAIGIRRRRKC